MSLLIEHLECMKASGKCNYDFVITHATDNSISFYESMGFVRVGALMKEEQAAPRESGASSNNSGDDSSTDEDEVIAERVEESSPEKPNAIARPYEIISSKLSAYTTIKPGETPSDIAKKNGIDVWDLIFLNKDIYKGLIPGSRLMAGTLLHIPLKEEPEDSKPKSKAEKAGLPQWYVAKEDDTPRIIARKFDVNCLDLVNANKGRLEGLMSNSRLKAGTRVKVSHLDIVEFDYKPYAHWTFPDDQFEEGEPSYMMALRLNRRRGTAARSKPFQESLAVPVSAYEPTTLVLPPSPGPVPLHASAAKSKSKQSPSTRRRKRRGVNEPQPPKRPMTAYMFFQNERRENQRDEMSRMSFGDTAKFCGDLWREMTDKAKAPYEKAAKRAREKYLREKNSHQRDLDAWKAENPDDSSDDSTSESPPPSEVCQSELSRASISSTKSLYNMVVRLKSGAMTEGSEYTYWYASFCLLSVFAEAKSHLFLSTGTF
jgi:hypothetical protein